MSSNDVEFVFDDVVMIKSALEFLIESYEEALESGELSAVDVRESRSVLRKSKKTLRKVCDFWEI